jgi:hypothetical protein
MNEFGRRLEEAAAVPRRRRPRVLLLAGPAVGAALVLTALLLLLPGGSTTRRLDVVAEARAALASQDDRLVHLVVAQHVEAAHPRADFHSAIPPVTTEQWSATAPVRWRVAYVNPPGVVRHGNQPVEVAYADGVEEEYHPDTNTLRRTTGTGAHSAPAAFPLGTDPVAQLRALLARGELHDAGATTIGGRDVRRLVGVRTREFNGKIATGRIEYDVDPTTYAPVRARIEPAFPIRESDRIVAVLDFRRFERLPLTAQSVAALKIHPKPGVRVHTTRARR